MRAQFGLRNGLRAIALATAGIVIAAVSFTSPVSAITDTVFKYSTPKTGHYAIASAAFATESNAVQFVRNLVLIRPATNTNTCFIAPVNLPTGVNVTRLRIWYTKVGGSFFSVGLLRQRLIDGSQSTIASGTPPDTATRAPFNLSIPAANQKINNGQYNYMVLICADNTGNNLSGTRITYTYRFAGD